MREAKRIIRALGDVDDRYIEEAAPGKKNRTHLSYRKLAVSVACSTDFTFCCSINSGVVRVP